jgi:hypothetical protein
MGAKEGDGEAASREIEAAAQGGGREDVGARERTKGAIQSLWGRFYRARRGKRALAGEGMAINAMGVPVFKAFKGRGLDAGETVGD